MGLTDPGGYIVAVDISVLTFEDAMSSFPR